MPDSQAPFILRHTFYAAILAGLMATASSAQSILTVAGGGPLGDGKKATDAILKSPSDIAFDSAGNMFIADEFDHRVRRVEARTGIITTYAGGGTSGLGDGGPATAAELQSPHALLFNQDGDLLVATYGLGPIRRIDRNSGIITTYAGAMTDNGVKDPTGLPPTALWTRAEQMALDTNGDVLLADFIVHHRILRLSRTANVVTVVAGNGVAGSSGDGGLATAASIDPNDVAVSPTGGIFVAERSGHVVRRIDPQSGVITRYAGNGTQAFDPNYVGPATGTALSSASRIAFDADGNLFITDGGFIRVVDAKTQTLRTVAGGGPAAGGDGKGAREAALILPSGVAIGPDGSLYVVETGWNRVRRIDKTTTKLSSVAGGADGGDGGPALSAQLFGNQSIAVSSSGDVFIADTNNHRIRKLDRATGIITTVAGNGLAGSLPPEPVAALQAIVPFPTCVAVGDSSTLYIGHFGYIRKLDLTRGIVSVLVKPGTDLDGGATQMNPTALAVGSNGDVYFTDSTNNRVRKYEIASGRVVTVAGTGPNFPQPGTFGGDGGPATAAQLNAPQAVVLDRAGNVYISDAANQRVRLVDRGGMIRTIAGTGLPGPSGDDNLATAASLHPVFALALDSGENLYLTETAGIVRRVDKQSGIITTITGNPPGGFTGDGGPVRDARLGWQIQGLAFDGKGNLFISDTYNSRVRAVFACVPRVEPPLLSAPSDGATNLSTSPALQWSAVAGGFRYHVNLDTKSPPAVQVASNLTVTTFAPSNLSPGTKYYWQVEVTGDPFCYPFTSASSAVASFTTSSGCPVPPAFSLTGPADGATNVTGPVQLTWTAAPGAATYDVYFGPSDSPPLIASGITPTNYTIPALAPQTTYRWYVLAHASCDSTKTTAAAIRSFTSAGACTAAGPFSTLSPASGATNVPLTASLSWSASANASSYDLYFGTTSTPALYLLDQRNTTVTIGGLTASRTYSWRVVAKVACDSTKNVSTPVATFTTAAGCAPPGATSISFVPPGNVGVGQTYTVTWKAAAALDADGSYIVERSLSPAFDSIVDSQQTYSTSASFISTDAGVYYHRVRPVHPCDLAHPGPSSEVKGVTVINGNANVIFTVQPQAVITALGENLEDRRSHFTLENLGTTPLQVVLGRGEINSVPFFTVSDPQGGDSQFFTLDPRTPKSFDLLFSGPPNSTSGSYQGILFVAAMGQGLTITPYAFVNLKVGGGASTRPQFTSGGLPTEYAFFPGFSGDDPNRPAISVDIRNDGTTPMELGAEIGPEVWLVPQAGWNSAAIEPGTSRTVSFKTRRRLAANGSALPRYTYFTVRSKSGETARLLVQDNDAPTTAAGRTSILDPGSRSYVVPGAISTTATWSRLRLTNIGSSAVQTDLFLTPEGSDGMDSTAVKRATIIVPPNDVVTLTDPLVQLFGLARPAEGQIEVRAAPEKIGNLIVTSSAFTAASGGGGFSYELPTVLRGEGARLGSGHTIAGITAAPSMRTTLLLIETSGTVGAHVGATLYDAEGNRRGAAAFDIPRYGQRKVDMALLGGTGAFDGGRIDLTVDSQGGAVAGLVTMLDTTRNNGTVVISQPTAGAISPAAIAVARRWHAPNAGSPQFTAVAPVVLNGTQASSPNTPLRTSMGFALTSGSSTSAVVTYRPGTGEAIDKTITLRPGTVLQFGNVLEDLFGIPRGQQSRGAVFINGVPNAQIYARLFSAAGAGGFSVASGLPILPAVSEALTSVRSKRPLFLDGLEQSVDAARGTRWGITLNEIAGTSGIVVIRLYEAGNRSVPLAEKQFAVGAYQQLELENVFASLGLDSDDRRKDRTNVLCAVSAHSGSALVSAVGTAIDNRTGDRRFLAFSPTGGIPSTGVLSLSMTAPVAPPPTLPSRRRVAGR